MYCYLEFKLRYPKNLKLFSIKVKELFEPIVLKKSDWFLLFLKGKGNLYLTESCLSRNEMWCASDNLNNMCHICANELLDSNFNQAVIYKISIFGFNEIAPNFTYSQKIIIFKV